MHAQLLETMIDASLAASEVILEIYAKDFETIEKKDGSPVTIADQRAEAVILECLAATDIPVLGEESVAAGRIPALGTRYFVVDPLDGTKEFIKRNGEFTVNIALVENGRPTLGVVLAPARDTGFCGGPAGAEQFDITGGAVASRHSISVNDDAPMRVVASRSHGHAALRPLCESFSVTEDVSVGSSLKFCLIARGEARLYPRFTPTCEWDTAAGQAVVEAAGGTVLEMSGQPLSYGKRTGGFLNPFFVAASNKKLALAAAERMQALVNQRQRRT